MSKLVVDASVVIKWLVEEEGTDDALVLLKESPLAAPDLLMAECTNILWKKVRRNEMSSEEALISARLLEQSSIEICPTRNLLATATRLAISLDHPANDCVYLASALENDRIFTTADGRFCRKIQSEKFLLNADYVKLLSDMAAIIRGD